MPQSQASNPFIQLFPLILIFIVFYFLLIRPQKSKEKEHQKKLANLNKNDEIVTSSGIHGTIVSIKDKSVIVRIDENVKIELDKNCVAIVKKPQGTAAAS